MMVDEFIRKTVGVKWVDRAHTFEAMDCWGLVLLYYKSVLHINLNEIPGYQSAEISIEDEAAAEANKNWRQQAIPKNHCVFLAYLGARPCHVGIVIDKHHVLHAKGNQSGGQVQYNKLDAIRKTYTKVEYYEYANLF